MDTINLKEQEKTEMRLFYQEELSKTLSRLDHIRSMLNKLGVTDTTVGGNASATEEKDVKLAGIKKPVRERKRPGRKSTWEALFISRLKEANRPMTYIQITNAIMDHKKLDKSKFESTKQAVLAVAYRLRARDGKIGTFTIGNREKYVALAEWYDNNGFLKQEYKDRIVIGDRVPLTSNAKKNTSARKTVKKSTSAGTKAKTTTSAKKKRGRPAKKN